MSKFVYKAKKGPNQIVQGTIEAEHLSEAILKVENLGCIPFDITPAIESSTSNPASSFLQSFGSFSQKVPVSAVVIFTRQTFDLLDAGLP